MDPVCTLTKDNMIVKAGSAVPIYKEPINDLLKRCGNCTRQSCVITFHLETEGEPSTPINFHFLSSLKNAEGLKNPHIHVSTVSSNTFDLSQIESLLDIHVVLRIIKDRGSDLVALVPEKYEYTIFFRV